MSGWLPPPSEPFGRRGLLRQAADAVLRIFSQAAGVPEAAEHLHAAIAPSTPPPAAPPVEAEPMRLVRCEGIWCHMVSCTGCACGGHLFRCTGCGRDYVACIPDRGCWSFCFQKAC